MKKMTAWLMAGVFSVLPFSSWAALPLITDDTGTQGKGKFQIEVGGEYDRDRETFDGITVKETDYQVVSTFTYGTVEPIDLFVNVPYGWTISRSGNDPIQRVNGISDTAVGLKWRFFDQQGTSLALKPFVFFPTGNEEKVFGTGRIDYGVVLIGSRETGPWSFHANFGYTRNENKIGERKDLWQASLASTYEIMNHLKLCADIGAFTNRDKTSEVEPNYALGGFIYSLGQDLELSFAFKHALNGPETDWALLPGVTYRF